MISYVCMRWLKLAKVHMNTNGEQEDGNEGKVDDGMDKYGDTTRLKVTELDEPVLPRHLEEKTRRQEYEEQQRYEHRSPVRHLPS